MAKIYGHLNVEIGHLFEHQRPHVVVQEKKEKNLLIDISVPGEVRVPWKLRPGHYFLGKCVLGQDMIAQDKSFLIRKRCPLCCLLFHVLLYREIISWELKSKGQPDKGA